MNIPVRPGDGENENYRFLTLLRAEVDRIERSQKIITRSVRNNFIILILFAVVLGFNLVIQFGDILLRKFGTIFPG